MKTQIKKWGNSLAVRIPTSFAREIGIKDNDHVEIFSENGCLLIKPIKRKKYSLEELTSQITEDNMHSIVDFGEPVGKEIW